MVAKANTTFTSKVMKRKNNLFGKIISIENLKAAELKARKGKTKQPGVKEFDKDYETNILKLHSMLADKTFRTSEYITFKIYEPKERVVYRLPYFPDRIAHHAIMNILEELFVSVFTADTYSCIKGKGIHGASSSLIESLKDTTGTKYCLKLDIKKFYPNVDHQILKQLLRRKIKDNELLWLLDEIIDSADGLPIGNYLSQYLANFYLTYFDHWIKETKQEKHYFRYADDMVILSGSKTHLQELLVDIREYLDTQLKLTVKENYQVFPVASRGIDFVGYVHYHGYVLLRKSIKKNCARKAAKGINKKTKASYNGWLGHCNAKHLTKKIYGTTKKV